MNQILFVIAAAILIAASSESINKRSDGQYFRTPYGMAWSECQYVISNGDMIKEADGKTLLIHPDGEIEEIPPCPRPVLRNTLNLAKKQQGTTDGWQVWTAFNNANNVSFDSFLGNFNVPEAPSDFSGEILYLFTGLQNDNWLPIPNEWTAPSSFDIIQPVLQYTSYGNWQLASWYVTISENVFTSAYVDVNPGDNIFGNMSRVNETAWFIGSYDVTTNNSTSFIIDDARLSTQAWAYCTLEVYGITDCSTDFPPAQSPVKFTNLELYDVKGQVTPVWDPLNDGVNGCQANVAVISPTSVTITF